MLAKSRRGPTSAFGLALVSILALGALMASAAQASPVWHVNGKTFAQAGVSEAAFKSEGGTVELRWPAAAEVLTCETTTSTGILKKSDTGNESIHISGCEFEGLPSCEVQPIDTPSLEMKLVEVGGVVYEKYTNVSFMIRYKSPFGLWYCPHIGGENGEEEGELSVEGSFAAAVGSEAVKLSRSVSEATEKATGTGLISAYIPAKLSYSSTQWLTGGLAGNKIGAW